MVLIQSASPFSTMNLVEPIRPGGLWEVVPISVGDLYAKVDYFVPFGLLIFILGARAPSTER